MKFKYSEYTQTLAKAVSHKLQREDRSGGGGQNPTRDWGGPAGPQLRGLPAAADRGLFN